LEEWISAGRWFSEWDNWFAATGAPVVSAPRALRFSQLEQLAPAAIAGDGVAMGAMPHFTRFLSEGRLCAPFGQAGFAYRGDFYVVVRRDVAGDEAVQAFVAWLKGEVRGDGEAVLDRPRGRQTRARRPLTARVPRAGR
jgi:DNA-binding transcriptional LysR family regulator